MRLPIQVQIIVFRTTSNGREFLILHRTSERDGSWQSITGGLESEDNLLQAVIRELKEETGIANHLRIIENVHFFQFPSTHSRWGNTITLSECVFGVEVDADQQISITQNIYPEHDEYRWCNFEDAMQLLAYDSNKESLLKLVKIIDEGE